MNISLKLQKKLLIKNAYDIWKRLKKSIRDYHSSADISIQEKASIQYLYCREKLKEIMSIKEQELHSSLVEKYPNKPIGLINQMKSCYAASSLGKWKNYCKINLEEELDCFDEFLLWIKNN